MLSASFTPFEALHKPLDQLPHIRRDLQNRIAPDQLPPAHAAMQELCEGNTLAYLAADYRAAAATLPPPAKTAPQLLLVGGSASSSPTAAGYRTPAAPGGGQSPAVTPSRPRSFGNLLRPDRDRSAAATPMPMPTPSQSPEKNGARPATSSTVTPHAGGATPPGAPRHLSPQQLCAPSRVEPLTPPPLSEPVTIFQSRTLPALSLCELAFTLNRTSKCGPEALLVAIVLMWRYCVATGTKPTAHMMHRLYVACLHIGIKTHSDVYYRNDCFAKLAGVSLPELNRLEQEVLRGLEWHTLVAPADVVALVLSPSIVAADPALHAEEKTPQMPPRSLEALTSTPLVDFVDITFNATDLTADGSSFASTGRSTAEDANAAAAGHNNTGPPSLAQSLAQSLRRVGGRGVNPLSTDSLDAFVCCGGSASALGAVG